MPRRLAALGFPGMQLDTNACEAVIRNCVMRPCHAFRQFGRHGHDKPAWSTMCAGAARRPAAGQGDDLHPERHGHGHARPLRGRARPPVRRRPLPPLVPRRRGSGASGSVAAGVRRRAALDPWLCPCGGGGCERHPWDRQTVAAAGGPAGMPTASPSRGSSSRCRRMRGRGPAVGQGHGRTGGGPGSGGRGGRWVCGGGWVMGRPRRRRPRPPAVPMCDKIDKIVDKY